MKEFANPEINVEKLDVEDVMTASCPADCPEYVNCDSELGIN